MNVQYLKVRELFETFDQRVAEIPLRRLQIIELRLPSVAHEVDIAFWENRRALYVEAMVRLTARRIFVVRMAA